MKQPPVVPSNDSAVLEAEATRRLMAAGFGADGLPIQPPESVDGYYEITGLDAIPPQKPDPKGMDFVHLSPPPEW